MNKYLQDESNYDKWPVIKVKDTKHECLAGWAAISQHLLEQLNKIQKEQKIIVFECYQGVSDKEIVFELQKHVTGTWFFSKDYMLSKNEIDSLVYPDVTDDEVFGYMTRLTLKDFFDANKLQNAKRE